jgi:predicted kinase
VTPTIHLTRGLPASGKTTFARSLVEQSGGRMRRVNLDELRAMLDFNTTGERLGRDHEETVLAIQDQAVLAAIQGGFDVICDNTFLVSRLPNRLKRVVAGQARFELHDFLDVPVEECIRRDALRANSVGEEAIRAMAKRIGKSGSRWTAEQLNDMPKAMPYVPDEAKPKAVIFDIDGTLALSRHRGPYDFDRCETDELNGPVAQALTMYAAAGFWVILLSGRQSEYREHTLRWLSTAGLPWCDLFMRAEGDRRSDDIVKAELFDEHVRHRFNVAAIYDDRDRVVALWRRMGLTCMQVAYGNF